MATKKASSAAKKTASAPKAPAKKTAVAKKATAPKAAAPVKAAAPKTAAKKTPAKIEQRVKPSHDEIAALAHRYWAERGYGHGSHHDDWLRAERDLS